ncbi:MAG TPA: DegT/DnrJ/EryC1/StrS family aminotransferase [Candidatus Hydrogenedentes bacterium]|nr:DegT/DnrJ/EryC1/StrS family aminotransferase [Candidatus Hydrogenedentota bacterium]HPG65476.1 DegT/DnrJ/EryC1/StrS family aminotransferase [Candidatus Hydrogenedentota bacterium]
MIPFAELKSQFKGIEPEIRAAINDVLESAWFVFGKHHKAFEEEFAAYVGANHALGVGSGTEAIHLALTAVGVGPGDDVITVANTCVPTVAGIGATGATPTLVDIDAGTLTMDPARIEAAITPHTRAIVPVHLYGHPCDMDPILEMAARHGIQVIEDCAQAHGARYRGRPCGILGRAAAFSFYPSKNLGAYGDGGAVVTNDADVAERVRMLRNYGEETRYFHTMKGINSRLDELQAAILRVKLKYLDDWNAARRERAKAYRERLAGLPLTLPVQAKWATAVYHLYVVRTPERDALREYLRENEIGTQLHYPVPIHLQRAYADLGYARGDFPESEKACDEVLSLPMYPELAMEDLDRVAAAVRAFFA